MNRVVLSTLALLAVASSSPAAAQSLSGKKVLFVNSYHQGYEWSDGEEAGAATVLKASGVEMRVFRMDAKRHPEDKAVKEAGLKVKALIESYRPDVVIVADDIATQVMVHDYKNVSLPWVFCGVNWDASHYGLPFKNATGMVEVALLDKLLQNLKGYAKGTRLGFLSSDTETERTEQRAYHQQLKIPFAKEKLVKTFAEWKAAFRSMQGEVDALFLGNFAGINDWNEGEAAAWALAYGKIPSGAMYDFMMPYAMLGMTKIAEEQGIWSAKTALAILKGKSPAAIPIVTNKEAKLFVNVKLASKAGIVFKPELISNAQVIR
jgi:ABC-type uncharacterized transport system substrate-binding protein